MRTRTASRAKGARRDLDAILDAALEQTFPASDPFSVGRYTATEPPLRPVDRRAPRLDSSAVVRKRRKTRLAS
jgi:hypothetical protein